MLPHLFAVDAPRPDEVRFLLDKPIPDLPRRLASSRLGIVSPRALEPQSGQSARFVPDTAHSGTGAFQAGTSGPGRLELDEYNRRAREFRPAVLDEPYRYLDEEWVKRNYPSARATELYELAQRGSRNLQGRGAGLRRADLHGS